MKMYLINALAMFLIMVTFRADDFQGLDYSRLIQLENLQSSPAYEMEPVTTEATLSFYKFNYIAQGFFPIVTIAETQILSVPYLHYISVFNLYREKEFFLLI